MKKVQITKINVGSLGKVIGFVQAIIGLVYGIIISLGAVAGIVGSDNSFLTTLGVSTAVAIFAILILPALGFVIGWIQGVVVAAVLNIVFRESKGLEIEVQDVK